MLFQIDRAARHLRDRIVSRSTRADTMPFLNGVLTASGRAPVSQSQVDVWTTALVKDKHLSASYQTAKPFLADASPGSKKRPFETWEDRARSLTSLSAACYMLIRAIRPTKVVETGVWFGASTSLILAAMQHNAHGTLISIDLPAFGDMTGNQSGGSHPFIPDAYKDRWDLRQADATTELPRVFLEEKPDIFMHDSDHSYQHMAFEFALATKYLPHGSIVISDDIRHNSAFYDVMSQANARTFNHQQNPSIGAAVL
jgi:predicted O-methyltransferase YrrM